MYEFQTGKSTFLNISVFVLLSIIFLSLGWFLDICDSGDWLYLWAMTYKIEFTNGKCIYTLRKVVLQVNTKIKWTPHVVYIQIVGTFIYLLYIYAVSKYVAF